MCKFIALQTTFEPPFLLELETLQLNWYTRLGWIEKVDEKVIKKNSSLINGACSTDHLDLQVCILLAANFYLFVDYFERAVSFSWVNNFG